ncbi:MAG: acetate--CoA ligase family protein [Candidatus Rokubacteria bacterium]|nr:acetate--CoA ligase family protein [Candidatus Rokubacteria bacterium]
MTSALGRLFRPRAIALVGVPGDLSRPGARPLHFLRRHRYAGQLYLVNPGRREIAGFPVYPDLAALPGPIDVAWVGVPGAQAPGVVAECGRLGIPFAVVLGAGFAEAGEDGEAEQVRLREAARAAGVRLVGPNTVGFVNAWDHVALTFSTVGELDAVLEGSTVILSQSGGVGGCLLNRMVDRRAGVGLFVSTGNEADLEMADYLDWVVDDGRATTVACIVEQVRSPGRMERAVARALARDVAVVALKLGGSETGARAARSHTGSLVGRRDAWRAWARGAGIVEVGDLEQLQESATQLARTPRLAGHRVGMLTSSGGIAVMLADALEPRGFRFPPLAPVTVERVRRLLPRYATVANPLDITAGLPEETFGEVMAALLTDPGLDALVAPLTMATADGGRARAEQVVLAARGAPKPVAVYWPSGSLVGKGLEALEEARVPLFPSLATCAAALGASLEYRRLRERTPDAAAPAPPAPRLTVPERTGPLPWAEARDLLAQAGLRLAPELVVTSEAAARAAAGRVAFPAVVKLLGPVHKTEVGAVRLGLRDADALLAAVRELLPRGAGDGPCLVQPMLEGLEVLVGAIRDPVLGPFVVVAPGGIDAELYGERAMRPAPVGPAAAAAMIEELPALSARLGGYRGGPPADRPALVDAVVRVAGLAAALGPRLAEVDLNPVIVGRPGAGATAVDWRVFLEAPP